MFISSFVPRPPSVPSSSPFLLFTLALFLCLTQQRMANAFLLTHRNLLLPFASSKGAGIMAVPAENKEEEPFSPVDEEETQKMGLQKRKTQMRLLGFMAMPKSAIQSLRQQIEGENDGKVVDEQQPRERRKRMHHLSILRKVGAPNGQIIGSRLFGPQKHTRELKRTVPLFLVEY